MARSRTATSITKKVPEMIKCRPVVLLSRRNGNLGLCTVVPLSGTEPSQIERWHHKMTRDKLPQKLRNMGDWWAKCDCITTVSFERLDRISNGKDINGKRLYVSPPTYAADLAAIRLCVINHLAMTDLISVH